MQSALPGAAATRRSTIVFTLFAIWLSALPGLAETKPKNVILMIADGAGYNTWQATSMYQGKLGRQVYDAPGWSHYLSTTYPLTRKLKPTLTGVQDPRVVYDPVKVWNTAAESPYEEKVEGLPTEPLIKATGPFAGYNLLRRTATDSAAAATALATGVKTYDNAINWTDLDEPLAGRTIAELAKRQGKSAGVITTVQWSHATPAALGGAHNVSRNKYAEIANEMLNAPYLDVIMGTGHPDFDDNGRPFIESKPLVPLFEKDGQPIEKGGPFIQKDGQVVTKKAAPAVKRKEHKYVGGPDTWKQLKSGAHPAGWTLIETKAAFEKLTDGPAPRKVLGTAQTATTLQQKRGKPRTPREGETSPPPFSDPLNRNVPTLATMTRAALNSLDDNPNGFYLMIEGGAVDWANHANLPERMIEEQIDFLQAVEAVVRWVETQSTWDETLVILTADHETGMLWGPHSDRVPFDPLVDRGRGNLPALKYNYRSHTNSLVPLYARGPGSEQFAGLIRGRDATAAAKYGISGQYVDNTDVFTVMKRSLVRVAEPVGPARQAGPGPSESRPCTQRSKLLQGPQVPPGRRDLDRANRGLVPRGASCFRGHRSHPAGGTYET